MLQKSFQIIALFTLWAANIFLVISLWSNIFSLGVLGVMVGILFGLPSAYLWYSRDSLTFSQFRKHVSPFLEKIAYPNGRNKSQRSVASTSTTEQENSVMTIEHEPQLIKIPVAINEEIVANESFKSFEPEPKPQKKTEPIIKVKVEIASADDEDIVGIPVALPIEEIAPPQPSEWDLKKAADAEYERIREILAESNDFEAIADYLDHQDERVRLTAIQTLRHIGDERVNKRLEIALEDDADVVKRAARIALQELDKKS